MSRRVVSCRERRRKSERKGKTLVVGERAIHLIEMGGKGFRQPEESGSWEALNAYLGGSKGVEGGGESTSQTALYPGTLFWGGEFS